MKVRQLHREFLRAGSDVMQVRKREYLLQGGFHNPQLCEIRCLYNQSLQDIYTVCMTLFTQAFTYYASEDKLTNRGNEAGNKLIMNMSNIVAPH